MNCKKHILSILLFCHQLLSLVVQHTHKKTLEPGNLFSSLKILANQNPKKKQAFSSCYYLFFCVEIFRFSYIDMGA